eukprot:6869623-Alexandrium_andersonii.AAC.1
MALMGSSAGMRRWPVNARRPPYWQTLKKWAVPTKIKMPAIEVVKTSDPGPGDQRASMMGIFLWPRRAKRRE